MHCDLLAAVFQDVVFSVIRKRHVPKSDRRNLPDHFSIRSFLSLIKNRNPLHQIFADRKLLDDFQHISGFGLKHIVKADHGGDALYAHFARRNCDCCCRQKHQHAKRIHSAQNIFLPGFKLRLFDKKRFQIVLLQTL